MDFLRMNGTPVRISGVFQRTVPRDDGPPLQEVELVVILRGTMAHRSFQALLAKGAVRLDLPDGSGAGWTTFDTEIAAAYHSCGGSGEAAAYRHDVTLRETPASAERRAAERGETVPTGPAAAGPVTARPAVPEIDDDPSAPDDFSQVRVAGDAAVWATALRQMTATGPVKPPPPEPPLETAQLAGAEAVLVGLRLEALIEQLVAAGVVRRSGVDASFLRLVRERFVREATPVIGQRAAERAAASALEQ